MHTCVCLHEHMCNAHEQESGTGCWTFCNWNYRCLWDALGVLGTGPRYSVWTLSFSSRFINFFLYLLTYTEAAKTNVGEIGYDLLCVGTTYFSFRFRYFHLGSERCMFLRTDSLQRSMRLSNESWHLLLTIDASFLAWCLDIWPAVNIDSYVAGKNNMEKAFLALPIAFLG